jgi:hypothetical protein
MIKAFETFFDNPICPPIETRFSVWCNIHEVFVNQRLLTRSHDETMKMVRFEKYKASEVSEVGHDIDGNPYVTIKKSWIKGPNCWHQDEMDQDLYITYKRKEV